MCVCVYVRVYSSIRENREFRSWGTAADAVQDPRGPYLRDDVLRLCDCVCVRVL